MTLIYSSSGFLGTVSGSPVQCSSPIGYRPDYKLDETSKNVDTCVFRTTSSSNLKSKSLSDRMRSANIRLSLEDVSLITPESSVGFKTPSQTSVMDDTNVNKRSNTPRSILKKSISADSASLASLREALLLTKERQSLSLSESSLASLQIDGEAGYEDVALPRSPSKNVTFADDNNLSLVKIHNFNPSNENLDQWQISFQHSYHTSRVSGNSLFLPSSKNKFIKKPELFLCFQEPKESPDFNERFKYRCVALERCATRDRTLSGIVLVKNIEYEKQVSVRYTMNRWKTSSEIQACYVPNSNDGDTDRFSFNLSLPKNERDLEFAIRYTSGSSEFWDNNFNRNYKVKDANLPN